MKQLFIFCLCFLCNVGLILTQRVNNNIVPSGGGDYAPPATDYCLSPQDRVAIKAQLRASRIELEAQGLLPQPNGRTLVSFDFPLKPASNLGWNNYYGISNFLDQDPSFSGSQYGATNLDYNCDNRSYDTNGGYNHAGTDYFTWPFSWYLYENNLVDVIAAAPGTIIGKFDGNEDDHCSCMGQWNAVYVQHADGSVAWYGHLKENALTTKAVGQSVVVGEYLGVVASSGCSTGPHLHFEVYDNNDNLIDPYEGPCNSLNNDSWWISQDPYRTPRINAVLTHDAPPNLSCGVGSEQPNLSDVFTPGGTVYTGFYYQDQLAGSSVQMRILLPNGNVWQSWNQTFTNTFNTSWWYYTWFLPTSPTGVYTLEATYNGETVSHLFTVGSVVPVEFVSFSGLRNSKTEIALDWQTANERNNLGFYVERLAPDQQTWENIGFVAAHDRQRYSFSDISAPSKTTQYRLRQVDYDGTEAYSNIITISGTEITTQDFDIYPNPVNDRLRISGQLIGQRQSFVLELFDINGRSYGRHTLQSGTDGSFNYTIARDQFPAGCYVLRLLTENGELQSRRVILR